MTQLPINNTRIRITRTDKRRSPDSVRRLGKALIALARAQLEADAEADAKRKDVVQLEQRRRPKTHPGSGDAA